LFHIPTSNFAAKVLLFADMVYEKTDILLKHVETISFSSSAPIHPSYIILFKPCDQFIADVVAYLSANILTPALPVQG